MDINTIVLIVILLVMLYAIFEHLKDKKSVAEENRQQTLTDKEEISNEEIATYGQVQERKGQLNELIDANLGEHPEQSAQLKDIIEDWANLKIESFENRRSWVRSPGQKKTDE
jgi:hypothetical protein